MQSYLLPKTHTDYKDESIKNQGVVSFEDIWFRNFYLSILSVRSK